MSQVFQLAPKFILRKQINGFKNMNLKKNWYVILIGFSTIILGTIAILTALRMYQAGNNPVAPNAPESQPAAQTLPTATPTPTTSTCLLTFNLTLPTVTLTPTPTRNPSATPTPTSNPLATPTPTLNPSATPKAIVTPTPLASCYHTCTNDSDCEGNLTCLTVAGSKKCVKTQCPDEQDCICPVVQGPTPTPVPTKAVAEEALPEAGTDFPTLALFAGGLILILIPLLLAF